VGFLSPLFLIGLLAIAVPILLHLYRHQAGPVVRFTAVRFLQHAPLHRARRRRLQDVLLLMLRVTALALLAVAFARPYIARSGGESAAPITIVAVDRSFSMSAPGQIDEARKAARRVIEELPRGERVAIVAFDERAEVVLPPTWNRGDAERALMAIEPGYGTTRFGAAFGAAADILQSRPGRLVVVSDLQSGGWIDAGMLPVPQQIAVEARQIATPPENLILSEVRSTEDGVLARVQNSGSSERTVRLTVAVNGAVTASRSVVVPVAGMGEYIFRGRPPQRGALQASVEDATGYAGDNARYAVLDPAPPRRVLVVAGAGGERAEAFYLRRAIESTAGDPDPFVLETITADRLARRLGDSSPIAAVVMMGSRGFDAQGGEVLEREISRGCGLLLVTGPAVDWPWLVAQTPAAIGLRAAAGRSASGSLTFAPVDVRHPVFRRFGIDGGALGAVNFTRAERLKAPANSRLLAQFDDGSPALMELRRGRGRVLVFASDLANRWNDFALHPAFVPFVDAMVRYVADDGQVHRELQVSSARGPEWARPGVHADPTRRTGERVALNVDLRESDRTVLTVESFLAAIPRAPADPIDATRSAHLRAAESDQSLWRYGLFLMLVGLVAEGVIGRKPS
jgi:hypothetical protein